MGSHGDTNWRTRLNDAGYNRPWHDRLEPKDNHVYLLDFTKKNWNRLSQSQPSPQNLYEMTSLVYDSRRDQLILHGAGKRRDELWTFGFTNKRWRKLNPNAEALQDRLPPTCTREAVYLPDDDIVLMYGRTPRDPTQPNVWAYSVAENRWAEVQIPQVEGIRPYGHNRVLLYDQERNLIWLVLGTGGAKGKAHVYVMRYEHQ